MLRWTIRRCSRRSAPRPDRSDGYAHRWLIPAWAETFFTVLRVCGLSDQEAVAAYRRLSSFLLGHLTIEVLSAVGSSRPNIATRAPGVRGFRLSSSPISGDAASAGVGWCPALTDSGFAEEFDRGLDHLLAGMPARRLVKHPRRLTVGEHGDSQV